MNYDDTVVYFFYLVYMLCLLHVLDRQIEYMSRVDFLSQKVRPLVNYNFRTTGATAF